MHGLKPFREALEEKLELAIFITQELKKIHGIEVLTEPQLSIIVFHFDPGTNEDNMLLLKLINKNHKIRLSGTWIDGRYLIRMCVLTHRTHKEHILACIESIETSVKKLLSGEVIDTKR